MNDAVQEIKDRLAVTDVVGQYVKLNKAGKYYKGLCPFHKEKTPSFMVSPDRGFYHCFGCNKGGDIFTFIEEVEGVDFRGALKLLADKAGVTLSAEPPGSRDRKEKILAALDDAETFFVSALLKEDGAREYLRKRGVTEDTVARWRVGYAPDAWRDALEYLIQNGHDESIIESAGLIKYPEQGGRGQGTEGSSENSATTKNLQSTTSGAKRPYDRFRGRIMFPLRDVSGRTVGFSGRAFPDRENDAKYLNSPETPVFDKSRILYGLDMAKEAIRKYGFAILVEGQFDLLLAQQTAYANSVALSGTAFTEAHANLLRRYSENLVLAFDGDRAGITAAGRAAMIALKAGLNVKIAMFPPGKDPADVISEDADVWKLTIKEASHVIDFYIAYLKTLGYDERRYKLEVSRVVLPYVAAVTNAIDRAHFVSRVAEELHVPESAVQEELSKLAPTRTRQGVTPPPRSSVATPLSHEPFLSRGDTLERLLVGVLQSLKDAGHDTLAGTTEKRLEALLGRPRIDEIYASPEESRISVIEGDLFLESREKDSTLEPVIDELLEALEKELTRIKYRETLARLKEAEKNQDTERIDALLKEVSVLAAKL